MTPSNDETTSEPVIDIRHVREVVGVVDNLNELETVADYLEAAGVDRSDIDLMADRWTILQKLGKYYRETASAADEPNVPRQALMMREDLAEGVVGAFGLFTYLGALGAAGAVMATGGALAAAAIAAAAGGAAAGGLGVALGKRLEARQLDKLKRAMEGGGLVLFARVHNAESEAKALDAMKDAGAGSVLIFV